MKRFKHKRSLLKIGSISKKNRRIITVVLSAALVSFTALPTFAYLTGSDFIHYGSGFGYLDMSNGKLDLDVDASNASWKDSDGRDIVEDYNPDDKAEVTYGPIYVEPKDTNLTAKLDVLSEYLLTNDIENNWNVGKNLCKPFEVIVGDIDNFNQNVSIGDPYRMMDSNTPKHTMDIYPREYDADGTDRRMAPTGFYNKQKAGILKPAGGDSPYFDCKFGGVLCDGYTQRAYYRHKQDWKSAWSDNDKCIMDGVDWHSLQQVRPISFKYEKIPDDKNIETVTFQIFTDDIQSSGSTAGTKGNAAAFVNSTGRFDVYLIGKDKNGYEFKEKVDELSDVINDYAQSGPVGNMRTLKLPSRYFDRIKEASGLNNGLKLLIDNEKTMKGDSYAIDFAKMTVNSAASSTSKVVVKGHITDDNGNPIPNANVYAEDGASTVADENGYYELETTIGLLRIKASAKGYADSIIDCGIVYEGTNLSNKDIKMSLLSEKYEVKIVATKCDMDGNPIEGEEPKEFIPEDDKGTIKFKDSNTIVNHAINLKFEPNIKYKLEYKVILKNKESIDNHNDFRLGFHLNCIKAKSTQENNNGWLVSGTGDDYKTVYKVNDYIDTSDDDSKQEEDEKDDGKTRVYFELPDTKMGSTYWWKQCPPILKYKNSDQASFTAINSVKVDSSIAWYVGQTEDKFKNSKVEVFEGNEEDDNYATNEGLIVHIKTSDSNFDSRLHVFETDKTQNSTNWNNIGGKGGDIKPIVKDGYHTYVIGSNPFSNGTEINTTKGDIGNSKSIYTFMGNTDGTKHIIPLNAKEIYYEYSSGRYTEINKDQWKYYDKPIKDSVSKEPRSSGELYFFNTRNIFICTN